MFEQDFYNDDEASADERGRSPRGAGGAARRAAEHAEQRMANGHDLFGSRRGPRTRAPFGGEAFAAAPKEKDFLDRSSVGVEGAPSEQVIELRDYSSKAVLRKFCDTAAARSGDPMADMKLMEGSLVSGGSSSSKDSRVRYLHEDRESALLSGVSKGRHEEQLPSQSSPAVEVSQSQRKRKLASSSSDSDSSSSSSSSTSSKKKKKKKKKKKAKEAKKEAKHDKKKKAKKSKKEQKRQAKEHKRKRKKEADQDNEVDEGICDREQAICRSRAEKCQTEAMRPAKQKVAATEKDGGAAVKRQLAAEAAEKRALEAQRRGLGTTNLRRRTV